MVMLGNYQCWCFLLLITVGQVLAEGVGGDCFDIFLVPTLQAHDVEMTSYRS